MREMPGIQSSKNGTSMHTIVRSAVTITNAA